MQPATLVAFGAGLLVVAVAALAYALLADPVPRIPQERRLGSAGPAAPLWRRGYRGFVDGVDGVLRSRGWVPFRASELEDADVRKPIGVVVTWILLASSAGLVLGILSGNVALGVLLALAPPLVAKMVLRVRTARRRKRFAGQLDTTLRIIASALRAGQSLPIAMASVGADAEEPMAGELSRVVNENRVGRDLVEAMLESAERMRSEDFRWFAEAVEVQRDTGGNLNDIIDVVAETIRDRAEIREKINAYASEGKASAVVLMGLPVALGVLYSVMRPGYLDPLFFTTVGQLLLAISIVLYGLSWVWMRSIIAIKV